MRLASSWRLANPGGNAVGGALLSRLPFFAPKTRKPQFLRQIEHSEGAGMRSHGEQLKERHCQQGGQAHGRWAQQGNRRDVVRDYTPRAKRLDDDPC